MRMAMQTVQVQSMVGVALYPTTFVERKSVDVRYAAPSSCLYRSLHLQRRQLGRPLEVASPPLVRRPLSLSLPQRPLA
jgi:hypothetical protein